MEVWRWGAAGALVTLALACAAAPVAPARVRSDPAAQPVPHPTTAPAEVSTSTRALARVACAARRSTAACTRQEGCVFEMQAGCREILDACDRVDPHLAYPGRRPWPQDPCTGQDPACVFHPRTQICAAYTPVQVCPADLEAARTLPVNCELQPGLSCRYDTQGGAVQCTPRQRTCPGGAERPPEPLYWDFVPDYAPNGCPLTSAAVGRQCSAPRSLKCTACGGVTQCIRGRWRQTVTPPPRP